MENNKVQGKKLEKTKKSLLKKKVQNKETEFEQKILDLARVTRVMAGGKRMRFRACVAIGDRKGQVGVGVAKGADVTIAINKAVLQAKKNLIKVPIIKETIPHEIRIKNGASKLMFKPAPKGTGIKAGGVVRVILDLAGVPNISSKILGSTNKVNNAKTTILALQSFKLPKNFAKNNIEVDSKKEKDTKNKEDKEKNEKKSAVKSEKKNKKSDKSNNDKVGESDKK